MAFGRACLLGDAAFVVRPHTAAATAKAAADAAALADALAAEPGDSEAALRAWEARQLEHGRGLWTAASPSGNGRSSGATTLVPTGIFREAAERLDGIAQPLQRL